MARSSLGNRPVTHDQSIGAFLAASPLQRPFCFVASVCYASRAMRRSASRLITVVAGVLLARRAASAVTIVAIGDSITWGVTRSSNGATPGRHDSRGGYPARLASLLGPGVRVLNRGFSGSTSREWLRSFDDRGADLRRFAETMWPDFHPTRDPRASENLLTYVLAQDRPDIVLVLLGVNDLRPGEPEAAPMSVAERIASIGRGARAAGATVLVGTVVATRRDPAAAVAATSEQLCRLEPACVRVDQALARKGGLSLLGDDVHLDERGQAVIAHTFARALRARGYVQ